MKRKVIGILVCVLLITTTISGLGAAEENKNITILNGNTISVTNYDGDYLDQYENKSYRKPNGGLKGAIPMTMITMHKVLLHV